jgi:hypothetical protein
VLIRFIPYDALMKYTNMKYIICDYCGQEFRNPSNSPLRSPIEEIQNPEPWKAHEVGVLEPVFTEGDRYSHTASICPMCIPVPEWDKA